MRVILIGWGSKFLTAFVFVSPKVPRNLELFGTELLSIFIKQVFSRKYVK
jgi:hypothetical protein